MMCKSVGIHAWLIQNRFFRFACVQDIVGSRISHNAIVTTIALLLTHGILPYSTVRKSRRAEALDLAYFLKTVLMDNTLRLLGQLQHYISCLILSQSMNRTLYIYLNDYCNRSKSKLLTVLTQKGILQTLGSIIEMDESSKSSKLHHSTIPRRENTRHTRTQEVMQEFVQSHLVSTLNPIHEETCFSSDHNQLY